IAKPEARTRAARRSPLQAPLADLDSRPADLDARDRAAIRRGRDAHVNAARALHQDALQADHMFPAFRRHETVPDQVAAERSAGAARRRILDDAVARSEHARVGGEVASARLEAEEKHAD